MQQSFLTEVGTGSMGHFRLLAASKWTLDATECQEVPAGTEHSGALRPTEVRTVSAGARHSPMHQTRCPKAVVEHDLLPNK